MHKAWCSIEEMPYCFLRPSIKFQGHMGWKFDDLNPIWVGLLGRSQLSNTSDLLSFPNKAPCQNCNHTIHEQNLLQWDSGHNGHKPERPKPKRPQTETATNRNGHRPKRPQTETATNLNGHRPERPQTETATNRNGHKPKWPQTGAATNRNGHKPERPQIKIDTTISDSAGYKSVCSI